MGMKTVLKLQILYKNENAILLTALVLSELFPVHLPHDKNRILRIFAMCKC